MGYKVTNPSAGVWHYEYALYNQNLDRGIQSFSVPLIPGVNISNIEFHAPPQEPGWTNDGTFNNQGYSSTPWSVTQSSGSIAWNTETLRKPERQCDSWGTLTTCVLTPINRHRVPMRQLILQNRARP